MMRLRLRIRNLVDDLHRRTARFLCENYTDILLPKYESSKMTKRERRTIQSKTARSMLTYAPYRFMCHLKNKAEELGSVVHVCNEAYTSCTCSNCSFVNPRRSAKTFKCSSCFFECDRDHMGSRNIQLRALTVCEGIVA